MKNNHIKNIFLISTVLTLTVWLAVSAFFVIINKKKSETSMLMAEISEQTSRKEEISSLAKEIEDLKEEITEIDSLFIGKDQDEVVAFIENLEQIASKSGVESEISDVEVVALKDDKMPKGFEEVALKIELEGNWTEVFHFLNLLENLQKHISFQQIQLDLVAAGDNEGEVAWKGYFDFNVSKRK
jgi:Tfp pilus assembly protein PilO